MPQKGKTGFGGDRLIANKDRECKRILHKRICVAVMLMFLCAVSFAQGTLVVKEIVIRGNIRINRDAILAAMRTQVGKPLVSTDLRTDEENILNMGFFADAKVLSRNVSDTEAEVLVEVQEYPIVKEIRIVGNTVFTSDDLMKIVTNYQQVGNVWNNRNARPINDEIIAKYREKGYFVQLVRPGPLTESPETLNIQIIEPTVNEITLVGLNRTQERTVRRLMKTKPGGLYSRDTLRRDTEELYYTYWFEEVRPEELPTDQPGVFNIVMNFKEARTAQLNAGVALDAQSRIVGTLSYNDTNFMGTGQSVGAQLSQATIGGGPSAEVAYTNRFIDSRDTTMSVQLFSKVIYNFTGNGIFGGSGDVEEEFNERRTGFGIQFSRPVAERFRFTVGVNARNSRTIDLQSTGSNNYIQQDGDLIQFQLGAEYDTRRPTGDPRQGENVRLLVEPGYSNITRIGGASAGFDYLLGRSNFLRTTIEVRKYWSRRIPDDAPIDTQVPVVAFRARFGHVNGKVPFFEQLFVGGSDSLRGYPNQRFWGNNSFLATVEYRHPIQKTFTLIGFADYGGAWGGYGSLNDFAQTRRPELKFGYGVGVGFRTPLGPIRIDFAFNSEGGSRTHFIFGTTF